eukprot:Rmarinus@m.21921
MARGAGQELNVRSPTGCFLRTAHSVVGDKNGWIFISDKDNHRIFQISPDGELSLLAGSGKQGYSDGVGEKASFSWPSGLAMNEDGDIYVSDSCNNRIRRVQRDGTVTTYAGSGEQGLKEGWRSTARFFSPLGLAFGDDGTLYVADAVNLRVRQITRDGYVTTVAGNGVCGHVDGTPEAASFRGPGGLCIDDDAVLYVGDFGRQSHVRCVASEKVWTLKELDEPGEPPEDASFSSIYGVAVDGSKSLYVADQRESVVWRVREGEVRKAVTEVNNPAGMFLTSSGDLVICELCRTRRGSKANATGCHVQVVRSVGPPLLSGWHRLIPPVLPKSTHRRDMRNYFKSLKPQEHFGC